MILNCLGMCLNSQEQRKYKDQLESALCILGTFRGSWYIWILETFFFIWFGFILLTLTIVLQCSQNRELGIKCSRMYIVDRHHILLVICRQLIQKSISNLLLFYKAKMPNLKSQHILMFLMEPQKTKQNSTYFIVSKIFFIICPHFFMRSTRNRCLCSK